MILAEEEYIYQIGCLLAIDPLPPELVEKAKAYRAAGQTIRSAAYMIREYLHPFRGCLTPRNPGV